MSPGLSGSVPQATRRHWLREAGALIRVPLSLLEGKHRDARGPLRLSAFRCILALFAWAFYSHWPTSWEADDVKALALILFALPLADLFAMIPVGEALKALQAFFGSVMVAANDRASDAWTRFGARRGRPEPPGPPEREEGS